MAVPALILREITQNNNADVDFLFLQSLNIVRIVPSVANSVEANVISIGTLL